MLYNLTDTYFIGLLDDPVQLGAISAATIVIGIAIFIFMDPILHLLGTSDANIGPTRAYLQVIVAFAVVIILQVILSSMLRAVGKVREAVIGIIIGTVLNIVLDPVFILVFHQGVAGAAIATIIGNLVGVVYYIVVYVKGDLPLSIRVKDCRPSVRIFSEVLKIGLPNSISVVIMSCSNIILNNLASGFGDHVVSAYGVSGKLIQMVFMIVVGYVTGYMPFAGYNYGAGNFKRMLAALRFTMLSGTGVCLALLVTFQATGQAIRAMTVNMGRQLLYNIPFLFLFSHLWGLSGLLYAQMAADYCTVITAVLIGIPLLRDLHQKSKQQTDDF